MRWCPVMKQIEKIIVRVVEKLLDVFQIDYFLLVFFSQL